MAICIFKRVLKQKKAENNLASNETGNSLLQTLKVKFVLRDSLFLLYMAISLEEAEYTSL